jgi:hypothetical protein
MPGVLSSLLYTAMLKNGDFFMDESLLGYGAF